MKFFLFLLILISCSEKQSNYFPLDNINSWTYSVEIIPEVENRILYKKTNTAIGEKKIIIDNKEKKIFPILREDGTTFFYEITDQGIYRKGVKYSDKSNVLAQLKTYDFQGLVSFLVPHTLTTIKTCHFFVDEWPCR